jgi:transcriptional regulator with XRE-family HTH domain
MHDVLSSVPMMKVRDVGRFIREQRRAVGLSVRKLASMAGVSNPYLSQIERGLRRPSAEILNGIAKALRISAETLYVQAGILDERKRAQDDLVSAILADRTITERQRQVLIQIYGSFREETERRRETRRKRRAASSASQAAASVEPPPNLERR